MANAISTLDPEQNQDLNLQRYQAFIPLLKAVTVVVLLLNSAFNIAYGFSQGVGWGQFMIGMSYGMGDLVLVCLMLFPTRSRVTSTLAIFSACGLFSLSVFSAAGYLISNQYQKDNFDLALQKRNVEILQSVYNQHHQLQTGVRLERETAKLQDMVKSRGGDGATAIYHAIGKVTGYPTNAVTLAVRLLWAIVFVVAGITLSRYCSEWTGGQMGRKPLKARRKTRSPTRDTQTQGDTATRYRAVRDRVRAKQLKPSIRALASEGMAKDTAAQYLKAMADEGVISRNGNGYQLT